MNKDAVLDMLQNIAEYPKFKTALDEFIDYLRSITRAADTLERNVGLSREKFKDEKCGDKFVTESQKLIDFMDNYWDEHLAGKITELTGLLAMHKRNLGRASGILVALESGILINH